MVQQLRHPPPPPLVPPRVTDQQEGDGHDILTGYSNGSIMTQDIRKAADDKFMPHHCKAQQTAMTCITMHPRVPVLATGSHKQFINVSC